MTFLACPFHGLGTFLWPEEILRQIISLAEVRKVSKAYIWAPTEPATLLMFQVVNTFKIMFLLLATKIVYDSPQSFMQSILEFSKY